MNKKNPLLDESIDSLREKIDAIDSAILSLIEERERCAIQIGKIKKSQHNPPVYYVPEREQAIIASIEKNYKGNFSLDAIRHIFQIIILNCRLLQR